MTRTKLIAAATATTLLLGGAILGAAPASGATVVGTATFYGASDFGHEASGYPTGVDWFFGTIAGTEGAHAFTPTGVTLNSNSGAPGNVQILNQAVGTQPASATDFMTLVHSFTIYGPVGVTPVWTQQITVFGEGTANTEFTTLRPVATGNPSPGDQWITSRAIGSAFAANDQATLSDLVDALFLGEAPELLAYGAFVNAADSGSIYATRWNAKTSYFGALPTGSISHTTITPADFSTAGKGLTVSAANWQPGLTVNLAIADTDSNVVYMGTAVVAADGTVSSTVVLPTAPPKAKYEVYFYDNLLSDDGILNAPFGTFTVGDVIAATGVDATPVVAFGGLTLLLGAGLVFAQRRRAAQR